MLNAVIVSITPPVLDGGEAILNLVGTQIQREKMTGVV